MRKEVSDLKAQLAFLFQQQAYSSGPCIQDAPLSTTLLAAQEVTQLGAYRALATVQDYSVKIQVLDSTVR